MFSPLPSDLERILVAFHQEQNSQQSDGVQDPGRGRRKRFREVPYRGLVTISLTEFRKSNFPPKQMVLSPCPKIPHGFPSLLAETQTPPSSEALDLHDLTLTTVLTPAPCPHHSSHKDLPSYFLFSAISWATPLPLCMLLSPVTLLWMVHILSFPSYVPQVSH